MAGQLGAVNVARQAAGMWSDQQATTQGFGATWQWPVVSSLLPRRTVHQMQAAHDYSYRDQLTDYMRKHKVEHGANFPTMAEIEKLAEGGPFSQLLHKKLMEEGQFAQLRRP